MQPPWAFIISCKSCHKTDRPWWFEENTPIQLLFVCYYKKKMVQPVLTRWEYVSISSSIFIERWQGYKKLAEGIKLKEAELITLIYFLNGFHLKYFDHHFTILKKKDTITKTSSYIMRHIIIEAYLMLQDLKKLKASY